MAAEPVEYRERECPLCKGEGAYDTSNYDYRTSRYIGGRSVCALCGGLGAIRLPILTIEIESLVAMLRRRADQEQEERDARAAV